jgi:two-component system catabolic regulation response regulator CreB
MLPTTIWLIEDESAIAQTLIYALQTDGFTVRWFERGEPMLSALTTEQPDLFVFDIGLPDISGFELARQVEARNIPFLFLTARSEELDRILGLEMGADDYIAKPFSPREVCARVRMILRRAQRHLLPPSTNPSLFTLNELHGVVTFCGTRLSLTRYEFLLIKTMLAEPLRIFPRQLLMDLVWTDAIDSFDRTVDTHIKTLRAKMRAINPDFEPIETHRGLGYSISLSE